MQKNETATVVSKPERGATRSMPDLGQWPDANGRLLGGWARCNAAVLEGAVELAQEILAFTQARVQADFEAWKALTDCRSPNDFLDHQKAFAEKATAQSLNEASEASKIQSKLTGILSKATTQFRERDTAT